MRLSELFLVSMEAIQKLQDQLSDASTKLEIANLEVAQLIADQKALKKAKARAWEEVAQRVALICVTPESSTMVDGSSEKVALSSASRRASVPLAFAPLASL